MSAPPELRPLSPRRVAVFVALIFGGVWVAERVTGSPIPLMLVGGVLLFATFRGRR